MNNLKNNKRIILNSVAENQRMVERYFESWQKRLMPEHPDQYIPFTDEEVEHIRLLNDRLTTLTIDTLEQVRRICDDLEEKMEQGNNDYEGFKLKAFITMNGHQFLMDNPGEILQRIHYANDFELAELALDYSYEDRHALIDHLERLYVEDSEPMIGWEKAQPREEHDIPFCEAFHWFIDVNHLFPMEDVMLLQPDNFESHITINI